MRSKLIFFLGMALILSGCMTMPGDLIESKSEFDGATEISVIPAHLPAAGDKFASFVSMGLYRRSTMPQDEIILEVVSGIAESFAQGESLHFRIDGEKVSLKSFDELTDFGVTSGFAGGGHYVPPRSFSSKRYRIDRVFLERLLGAKQVLVRLDLRRGYLEGEFSKDGPTTARPAFREFFKRVYGSE